jgi:predicted transposase YdaD
VTTIMIAKFKNVSREEGEAMLGLNLEEARAIREIKEEGRQEERQEMLKNAVPLLLRAGLTVEEIAAQLKVTVEEVQQAIA